GMPPPGSAWMANGPGLRTPTPQAGTELLLARPEYERELRLLQDEFTENLRRHQKTIAQLQKIIPDEMNRSLARGPLSPWGEGQYGYYFSPGTSLPPGVTVNTTINPSPNLDFSFPFQASANRLLGATRKALDTSALPDLGLMVLPSPQGVAFSPDGRSILTDGTSNTIRLWDAVNGEPFLWDD